MPTASPEFKHHFITFGLGAVGGLLLLFLDLKRRSQIPRDAREPIDALWIWVAVLTPLVSGFVTFLLDLQSPLPAPAAVMTGIGALSLLERFASGHLTSSQGTN